MRLALERLDVQTFHVDLSSEQRVHLREARGLRGTADVEGDRTTLSGGGAERIALDSLSLLLGELHLSSRAGIVLDDVGFALEQIGGRLSFDVNGTITASELRITIGNVIVEGVVKLVGAKLFVRANGGTVSAERVELAGFRLRVGAIEIAADTLNGVSVAIAWGDGGFRLTAQSLETPAAKIAHENREVLVRTLAIATLDVGTKISFGSATAEKVHTTLALGASIRGATKSGEPFVDFAVLDMLAGEIDVDVDVDLGVPVIGHRHATHRLRMPIERGTIDYRDLEDNLSKLEKALLDFAVRDGALVIERVNPLHPTRGHGKPIVFWPLSAEDLELAERERVRLAVLPEWRLAGSEDNEEEPTRKAITLRRLDLLRINIALALGPANIARGQLRLLHVGSLILQGNVFHDPTAPREGSILAEAKDLAFELHHLALGTVHADGAIAIAALSPVEVTFADVRPQNISIDAVGMRLERIVVSFTDQ